MAIVFPQSFYEAVASSTFNDARAIVVLAEDGNADQSDARALRTVLSLTGVKEGLKGHIVVELSDLDNEVLVKLVGGDLVHTVVAHDVIGRLMIQCARQPGLAQIWEDILGFENCEFYIKRWPQLHGMQFEDILISFPDAIPCGIKVASCGGKIILNPEDSYVLQEDDEILVIAEDDDSYAPAALPTSKRLPMVNQVRRGSFSQGSWVGEMQQASDKSVIISEILDPRTKNLLCTSKIMALAMDAEDQQINDVLEELFAEEFACQYLICMFISSEHE
ncbi:ION CHANNEL POLLUX-RELATED [Salix purpurea]|uniref:ION CHANNEL POLLUX-RELATED n=1 Tax=Salix purpurea TaxID=77065 RepID=A0A9Q0ZS90_SALPP|nr:ION CHANNEL POLLUX-RELATED [Salix purpurea]